MEMEDPSEEWEVEECTHLEENKSKLGWILNKGLGLGKKIVVTGVVISSAPLVLPPLVVFSALGFAFSVPFGIVFASYACTEKLMSKLLPGTKPPPLLLGYGIAYEEEDDEEINDAGFGGEIDFEREVEKYDDMGFGGEIYIENAGYRGEMDIEEEKERDDMGYGGKIDMEKEEEDEMEDIKGGVEMRFELSETGSEECQSEVLPNEDFYYAPEDEKESTEDVEESVKEEGYEEYVGENLDVDSREPLEGIDVKIEGMTEEGEEGPLIEESKLMALVNGDEENNGNVSEVRELSVVPSAVEEEGMREGKVNGKEENVLVRENKGLSDKVSEVDNGLKEIEKMDQSSETKNVILRKRSIELKGTEEERKDEELKGTEEERKDEVVTGENGEGEIKRETTGLLENIRDEGNVDSTAKGKEKNDQWVEELEKPFEDKSGKFGKLNGEEFSNKNKKTERKDKENMEVEVVIEMKNVVQGKKEEKIVNNVFVVETPAKESNGIIMGKKPEGVVEIIVEEEPRPTVDMKGTERTIQADSKEIASGSGLGTVSYTKEAGEQNSHIDYENQADPGKEKLSDKKTEDADLKELPETKQIGIASEKETVASSNEVFLTEEKIWEHIEAMKTIVGYKAVPHSTCIEELKALYIFTGVEPPASFKDDLVQVNAKLRFLMSVVGVK